MNEHLDPKRAKFAFRLGYWISTFLTAAVFSAGTGVIIGVGVIVYRFIAGLGCQ